MSDNIEGLLYFSATKDKCGKYTLNSISPNYSLAELPLLIECDKLAENGATWGSYIIKPKAYTYGKLEEIKINEWSFCPLIEIIYHDSMRYKETRFRIEGNRCNGKKINFHFTLKGLYSISKMIDLHLNACYLFSLCDNTQMFNDIIDIFKFNEDDEFKSCNIDNISDIIKKIINVNEFIRNKKEATPIMKDVLEIASYNIRKLVKEILP